MGGKYQDLKEVIFIAITDFILFSDEEEYMSDHIILNRYTYKHRLKDLIHRITEISENTRTSIIIEKWCCFFKYANKTSEEDLKKIIGNDNIIGKAYKELDKYGWSEEERAVYYDDKKREDDLPYAK